ncbi:MAG: 2-amino-4-hydroxy-6-hydroxymethyldihydropteridine diphosphokinase [Micromonosporaceae bacterium]|nr:2-amino-4-hydroxy-6-hydroxymethyldihydropteridine diphosphokinase [Micromonosporaceae bacterium]
MTVVVCSLGANLGDRLAQLQSAVDGLGAHRVSSVYETEPWGDPDQPAYLNAVAIAAADREPRDWLDLARSAEERAGRVRDPARRYGPRPLDVDLIDIRRDSGVPVVSSDPDLTLPHPRARLRAFVLLPWAELEPDATLAGAGKVRDLLAGPDVAADLPGVRRRADLRLRPGERP